MDRVPVKVLLIGEGGDGYVTRSLISSAQDHEFQLEWVEDYSEALLRIIQRAHDVYLLNYRTKQDDNDALLTECMAQACQVPIILLLEKSDANLEQTARQLGVVECLVQPEIMPSQLKCAIYCGIQQLHRLAELRQVTAEKEQLAMAMHHIATGVVITDPTLPNHPIVFVNQAFSHLTGYSREEAIGRNCRFLQGPDSDPATIQRIREAIAQQQSITCTLLNYRRDGCSFWNELTITPVVNEQGQLIRFIGLQTDVTARLQAEVTLRESEERYALAVLGANDGIWDWNLKTGELYFSPRWKQMLGYSPDEIGATLAEWFDRIHPDDLYWVQREIKSHLAGDTPHFENEHRVLHRNGTYRWMLSRGLAVRSEDGQATRIAGSQTDITARKDAEEKLLHDALYDTLTGLPNRILLIDRLQHAIQFAQRHADYVFALLFIDLDRFKVINDSLGHMLGDQLLIALAHRLACCLRPSDTIARLGGDEFVILLENISDADTVIGITDRIQQEFSVPFQLSGHEIFTAASIGIALSTTGYEHPEDLLRDADTAMYRAKAQGRGRYEIFHPGMHTHAMAQLQIETELRRAIEREELMLHYQPIISLKSHNIVGFEALLRWRNAKRGIVSPTEFIPVAEETGLIVPIGCWVLNTACRQMYHWQQQFPSPHPLTMHINLSGKQFTPQLIEQIRQVLQETGLPAQSLKLELTESILMENADLAVSALNQLRELGIQLAIDDFGTGYSSLSYLHRFPIDTLKIDQSFISRVDFDGEQLAIARTIMTLAWNLGMDVVAEGVETPKQLAQLRALHCEYAQGYLFSKPLDVQGIEQLMQTELGTGSLKGVQSKWPG